MSLHIGNLSNRCQADELERVFRRFGQCELLIKDRYGFVVYDFPAAAERALKMLQGRKICGEDLTLTWSRKQPKGFKISSERSRDSLYGSNSSRGRRDHTNPKLFPNSQEDVKVSYENVESNEGRPDNDGITDQEKEYKQENVNGFAGEGHGGDGNSDGTGGQLNVSANESFDRYKPDQIHEKETDDTENCKMSFSGGSPAHKKSLEKRSKVYDGVSQITCFTCGGSGHKMRNCRLKHVSGGKISGMGYKGDYRHENYHSRLDRGGSSSWVTQPARKYGVMRQYGRDRVSYNSGKRGGWVEIESNNADAQEYGAQEKGGDKRKHGNGEDISLKDQSAKIGRRSLHSDKSGIRPCSGSKSLEPDQGLKSHSPSLILQSSPQRISEASSPEFQSLTTSFGMNRQESFGRSLTPENTGLHVETGNTAETNVELEKSNPESPDLYLVASTPKDGDEIEKEELLHSQDDEVGKSSYELPNQDTQDSNVATNMKMPEDSSSVPRQGTDISPDELVIVLRHYGLEVPNETDMHSLTPETYFGSARIWPWSVIYYRRLRKGPISVENYARRLAQNEEFGIVDKFVRSSSGWGESRSS